MKSPARVSIYFEDSIRVEGLSTELKNKLELSGLVFKKDLHGYDSIAFTASPENIYSNSSFIKNMIALNEAGIFFAEDYTQMYSPAASMRLLQKKGILKEAFTSVELNSTGWVSKIHKPEN